MKSGREKEQRKRDNFTITIENLNLQIVQQVLNASAILWKKFKRLIIGTSSCFLFLILHLFFAVKNAKFIGDSFIKNCIICL